MAAPKKIDWDRIEGSWRGGIKSVLQIAAEYEKTTGQKVSHTAINKHFKELGIPRDLSAKIRAKADAIVSKRMVSAQVSTETKITEQLEIEVGAEMQANLIVSHRADIRRNRELSSKLLAQLESETGNIELFQQLGEMMAAPDDKGVDKLNELYHKVISLPSRIKSAKDLAETLKTLIGLEREAFGVDGLKTPGESLDDFLNGLAAEAK